MALNSGLSGLRTGTQQGTLHNVRATRIKNTGQECLLKVKAHGEQLCDSKQGERGEVDGGEPHRVPVSQLPPQAASPATVINHYLLSPSLYLKLYILIFAFEILIGSET